MTILNNLKHSKERILEVEKERLLLKLFRKVNKINNKLLLRGRKSTLKHILSKEDHNYNCILFIPLNVSPGDLVTHLPFMCKEKNIKYLYLSVENINYYRKLSSRRSLSSCCILRLSNEDINEISLNEEQISSYNLLLNEVRKVVF